MGGRGAYINPGGFNRQDFSTKEKIYWKEGRTYVKVIKHNVNPNKSLPEFSNSPNAIYALRNDKGKIIQIRVYDNNRMASLDIDLDHEHKAGIPSGYIHQHSYTHEMADYRGIQMLVPKRSSHQAISAENLARYASLIRKLSPKTKLISVKPTK